MKKTFKTFATTIPQLDFGSEDYLDEMIEDYLKLKGYVEINRSAPCIVVNPCGDYAISVTSTFVLESEFIRESANE